MHKDSTVSALRAFQWSVFQTVTIIGPGLLGASAGMAMHANGLAKRVVCSTRRVETRLACEQAAWCDAAYADASDAVVDADFVIICTPVHTILPLLEAVGRNLKPGCIVTDVGSTKGLIVRGARGLVPAGVHFVGSHPMAGSEKSGFAAAQMDLFQGRACFVTPLPDTDSEAAAQVVKFWRRMEMTVESIDPERHDEIVANISHLPHLLASTLAAYLDTRPHPWRDFAGGGLRDTTRVAAGDPQMWKEITEQNAEEILRAIEGFEQELQALASTIRNGQGFSIQSILERGQAYRQRLQPRPSDYDSA